MTAVRYFAVALLAVAQNASAIDIIAHRGYACDTPENSAESVERAWRAGADGVEVDVRVSGDGVPFLFHDAQIGKSEINDLPIARITTLYAAPITTLAELVNDVRSDGYYVFDLKTDDPEKLDAILDVVQGSRLNSGAMTFQSRSLKALDRIHRRLPGAGLTFLSDLKWRIPWLLHPSAKQLTAMLRDSRVDRVSIKGRSFVNKSFIDTIKATGREVHVWTINDPRRAIHYRQLGVDGLITDRVEDLIEEAGTTSVGVTPCRTLDVEAG